MSDQQDEQDPLPDGRCSSYARRQGVDPIGSAGHYDELVLIKRPLPWPRDVMASAEVAGALQLLEDASRPDDWRLRLQFICANSSIFRTSSMIRYQRSSPNTFAKFARTEIVERTERPGAPGQRDVLVCTHGKRDRCCGSLGGRLFAELDEKGGSTTMWRSSHLGGHRFAPTALILPEGTSWAFLDVGMLQGIANRSIDVELAIDHYRGCVGLDTPELQALDREGLRHFGWQWLDAYRSAHSDDADSGVNRGSLSLKFALPDGTTGHLAGTIQVRRRVLTPDCGYGPGPIEMSEPMSNPEFSVTSVKLVLGQ